MKASEPWSIEFTKVSADDERNNPKDDSSLDKQILSILEQTGPALDPSTLGGDRTNGLTRRECVLSRASSGTRFSSTGLLQDMPLPTIPDVSRDSLPDTSLSIVRSASAGESLSAQFEAELKPEASHEATSGRESSQADPQKDISLSMNLVGELHIAEERQSTVSQSYVLPANGALLLHGSVYWSS